MKQEEEYGKKESAPSHAVGSGPVAVIFFQDLAVLDDSLELLDHVGVAHHFLANHSVLFVVGVVGIAEQAILQYSS